MTFPAITQDEGYLALAGYLTYHPWVQFPPEIMQALQSILDEKRGIGGCENPDVLADWRECVRTDPQGPITHRSNILLYLDGGDWAKSDENEHWDGIGLLFCREDIDQTSTPFTVTYRVHIPETEEQDFLLFHTDVIGTLKRGNSGDLLTIRSYLDGIINNQDAWTSLVQLLGELELGEDEEE